MEGEEAREGDLQAREELAEGVMESLPDKMALLAPQILAEGEEGAAPPKIMVAAEALEL